MKKYISEMIFTFIFVLVVLGVTDDKKGTPVMCGLAIGLTLVLVHIVCRDGNEACKPEKRANGNIGFA